MLRLIVLLLMMVLTISGCSDFLKSPIELIAQPRLELNLQIWREVIEENLPSNGILVRPLNSDNLGSVDFFDWDNDGEDEVYAFYRDNNQLTAGVMVLDRVGNSWQVRARVEDVATDIAYASFVDLNQDGVLDLVMGLTAQDDTFKSLLVYEWREENFQLLHKDVYSELLIEDIDRDFTKDIFVLKLDRNSFSSASMLKYAQNEMVVVDEVELDYFINGYYNLVFGRASRDYFGVFIDFRIGSKSASNIIIYDEGKLRVVFDELDSDERYKLTIKNEPIVSQDIDGDGIIEIGNRMSPYMYESEADDVPYLNTWYKWNGKDSLVLVRMNYINEADGYRFDFPDRWADGIVKGEMTIIRSRSYLKRQFFDVYATPEEAILYKIFTIETVPLEDLDAFTSALTDDGVVFYNLGLSNNKVMIGYSRTTPERVSEKYREMFQSLLLKEVEIRTQFQLLN